MKKAYLFAAISIFFWSTTAVATKLLLGTLNSMQIIFASSIVAFLFLLVVNIFNGKLPEVRKLSLSDHFMMVLIGSLGIFFYRLFLYLGIDRMDSSKAFIINYLWPITSVVFSCILLKEKMTPKKIIALLLSFAGVIIVASGGSSSGENSLLGAIFCALGAVSYGVFAALNKKKNYDQFLSMMLYYLHSSILSLIYLLIVGDSLAMNFAEWMGMLWMGIFSSALPLLLWALALNAGDTAKISNLAYITPFLGLVWSYVILKEQIGILSFVGLAVIIAGILLQLKDKKSN